jgi:hypothetical protein
MARSLKRKPVVKSSAASVAAFMRRQFPNYPSAKQREAVLAAVGQALTSWSRVETALYELFQSAIQPQHPGACGCAFHALQTFRPKLAAVDAALLFRLHGNATLLAEWDKLRTRLGNQSQNRNHCAHFAVNVYFNEKNKSKRVMLEPLMMDYRQALKPKRPQYRGPHLKSFSLEFEKLSMDVFRFAAKIVALPR